MPGFDFITQVAQVDPNPYLIWILGAIFLFVGALSTIIIRMALLMYQWRREIDKEQAVNSIAIASLATLKPDVARNADDIRHLTTRISYIAERRFREETED